MTRDDWLDHLTEQELDAILWAETGWERRHPYQVGLSMYVNPIYSFKNDACNDDGNTCMCGMSRPNAYARYGHVHRASLPPVTETQLDDWVRDGTNEYEICVGEAYTATARREGATVGLPTTEPDGPHTFADARRLSAAVRALSDAFSHTIEQSEYVLTSGPGPDTGRDSSGPDRSGPESPQDQGRGTSRTGEARDTAHGRRHGTGRRTPTRTPHPHR